MDTCKMTREAVWGMGTSSQASVGNQTTDSSPDTGMQPTAEGELRDSLRG